MLPFFCYCCSVECRESLSLYSYESGNSAVLYSIFLCPDTLALPFSVLSSSFYSLVFNVVFNNTDNDKTTFSVTNRLFTNTRHRIPNLRSLYNFQWGNVIFIAAVLSPFAVSRTQFSRQLLFLCFGNTDFTPLTLNIPWLNIEYT